MTGHRKVSDRECLCGFVGKPKSVSGHVGGSRSKALGAANGRYQAHALLSSHGYVLIRVSKDHHRAFGPAGQRGAYAYEHDLVAEQMLGRALRPEETVHHKNGNRTDNRRANLEVLTRSDHAREHANHPGARDTKGRFTSGARSGDPSEWPEDLRVREFPA